MTDTAPEDALLVELRVPEDAAGMRLDVFLTSLDELPFSRSRLQGAIARGEILLNGRRPLKPGAKLRAQDAIRCVIPPPPLPNADPEDIPLDVLFEDEHVLVLNKPPGLVVHPAPGHPSGTLVNALAFRCQRLPGDATSLRPGIVHRLDKDTSGVMVACKSALALQTLAAQFAAHTIERRYIALCAGHHLPPEGTFNTGHSRDPHHRLRFTGRLDTERRAITHYRVLLPIPPHLALVACTLQTGRTHQIRVHLAEANAPILGDELYGKPHPLLARQALHADLLGFQHPDGRWLRFQVPLPQDLRGALRALGADFT